MGKLLEAGRSWSGHERNVAFLNLGTGAFASFSGVAGLDDAADSRGVGLTDWDQDGDMDLWVTSRMGPRLRFFRNDLPNQKRSLSIQLHGIKTNRDAIGARVTVHFADSKFPALARTLRAGEGYLSQAGKTLHFGLPEGALIDHVTVRWPNGSTKTERFDHVTGGKLYRLVEGTGEAVEIPVNPPKPLSEATLAPESVTASTRIVPHARLPLPSLPYQFTSGAGANLGDSKRAVFVTLWASWCQPCLKELAVFSQAAANFKKAGLSVLCLNVERAQGTTPESIVPKNLAETFLTGEASESFLEQLEAVQGSLVSSAIDLALPTSFLIDPRARLAYLYRGPVSPTQVLADFTSLADPDEKHRGKAVPFPGTWIVREMPTDFLAVPNKLLALGRTRDAFDYLERHITGETMPLNEKALPSKSLTFASIGGTYRDVANAVEQQNQDELFEKALVRTLAYIPSDLESLGKLALFYDLRGEWAKAIVRYRAILQAKPDHLAARNSLAWILATSPDKALRQPNEAIRLAHGVCQATKMESAEPLDVLGAALASAGRFDEALPAVRRAIGLAKRSGEARLVPNMEKREALYLKKNPYVAAPTR